MLAETSNMLPVKGQHSSKQDILEYKSNKLLKMQMCRYCDICNCSAIKVARGPLVIQPAGF